MNANLHTPHIVSAAIAGSDMLATLQQDDLALMQGRLKECTFKAGETLFEAGQSVDRCYFPSGGALCSFFIEMEDEQVVETILIGREGALGGVVSNAPLPAFARATVLHGGTFLTITINDLEDLKRRSPSIAHMFARYTDAVLAQVFQSIACNAVHSIEERAAKWLYAAIDRIDNNSVSMTQEQLALMMGVGRSYASRVLQRFKRDGILRTRRGGLEVLDKVALKQRGCTCNNKVEKHYHAVMGRIY